MHQILEHYANCIETILNHKIPARVTGGTVTPRWIRFRVTSGCGICPNVFSGLAEKLALALGISEVRITHQDSDITVEVPREDPYPVRLQSLLQGLHNVPPSTAVLGIADDGVPLLIHLPSPDVAHLFVAGATNSGKTTLLRTIVLSLAYFNCSLAAKQRQALIVGDMPAITFVLIDPKRNAFRGLEALPHLARPVISDPAEAVEALRSLARLMKIRNEHGSSGVVSWPTCVLVIDELVDLLVETDSEAEQPLTQLLSQGHRMGIHVVAATQRPAAAVIGNLVRANFQVRLCGKVASSEDAWIATRQRGTGAECLLGRGDFIAVAEGQLHRFQAAYIEPEGIQQVVAEIRRRETQTAYVEDSGFV